MRVLHDVHAGAVLHVAAAADPDAVHVAAHDHTHPHTALLADVDVADHLCAVVDVGSGMNARLRAAVRPEHSLDYSGQVGRVGLVRRVGRVSSLFAPGPASPTRPT